MATSFRGAYEHQLDDKNRLRIPSKFRKELLGEYGEKTYSFLRGLNGCIYVLPDETLDRVLEKLNDKKLTNDSKGALMFYSNIFSAEEDAQGRVLLSKELIAFAGITKNIVFVGVGNRVEIWAEEEWNKIDEDDENADFSVLAKFGV